MEIPNTRVVSNTRGGFPNHITSLLESFYSGGLRGWGANYSSQFQEALKSTSPSELQLKNWIRRRNQKRKWVQETNEEEILPMKRQTLWHFHQKMFAKTEAGREALEKNPGEFNIAASEVFQKMSKEERDDLKRRLPQPSHMTKGDIDRRASTIFRKIQTSLKELDALGYPPSASTTSNPPSASTTSNPPSASTTSNPPSASTTSNPPSASTTSNPPLASTTSNPPSASTTFTHPPHNPSSRSNPVLLSDSPVKLGEDIWLPSLGLHSSDHAIIQTVKRSSTLNWLNDNIISAAQMLLKSQSERKIEGFQSPQFGNMLAFTKIIPHSVFLQILHVNGNHRNVVSNITTHDGVTMRDGVLIFDSRFTHISLHTKKQICSLIRPRCKEFRFDIVNTQHQSNDSDCGLFAIAFATEIINHRNY